MHVRRLIATLAIAPGLMVGCFAVSEGVLLPRERDADAGAPPVTRLDASAGGASGGGDPTPVLPAHAVVGVEPDHGPFSGGLRAVVRGRGFSGALRVWFGDVEVPAADVVVLDANRAQVTVPAGSAGPVDVAAQNGDDASTRASLRDGYVYDAFSVTPASGPVSGGTVITLRGDGTTWTLDTVVSVDGKRCEVVAVRSPAGAPQELDCKTPPGTPGAKRVRVEAGDVTADVLDAFTYGDSDDGFRGGLGGDALDGELRVIALNTYTGRAVPGATVVVGPVSTPEAVHRADENGVVVVAGALGPKQTVTVAAPCFMPITFVDVPVDTVTVYLDPILSPTCLDQGVPTIVGIGGGSARQSGRIQGELVWPNGIELKRGPWDVPLAGEPAADSGAGPRRTAYVFELSREATAAFRLPAATLAVTPDSPGRRGYAFDVETAVGNLTLYALAGVEDRSVSPPIFTAYTLGIQRGVAAAPGATTEDVLIDMSIPLDHGITLDVTGPTPTARGPDRVQARLGVRLGTLGYVTLPVGSQTSLLPTTGALRFVGLPPLVGELAGGEYVLSASAFTGAGAGPPRSVLGLFAASAPEGAYALDGFVEVPRLVAPAANAAWDGRTLVLGAAPGGPEPDLTVIDIAGGGGLTVWTVAVPGDASSVELPDLATLGDVGAPTGALSITVTRGIIADFDYGSLRYTHLSPRGFRAYATDVFSAHR